MIDDHKLGVLGADQSGKLFDLARAEQSRWPRLWHRHEPARAHVEVYCRGEACRLVETELRRPVGTLRPRRRLGAATRASADHGREHHRLNAARPRRAFRSAPRPLLLLAS